MCCVLILLAFFTPRIVLFVLFLFTDYLVRAFDGFVLPFIGFLFLPATTLIIGFAVDIGLLGGGARQRRSAG